jgi:hypothetical protein
MSDKPFIIYDFMKIMFYVLVLKVCGFSWANNVRKSAEKAFVSTTLSLAAQKRANSFSLCNS